MAVPEQIPVVNYVADGIVKKFDVPFEYDQQSDLHVYVDGVEPTIDKYYFDGNAFNFYIAPTSGQDVKIKRITPKERDTDYNLHTNTVRPKALNTDFDRLWYVLQEVFFDVGGLSQTVQDEIIARIQGDEDLLNQLTTEISARMLGDEAVTEDLKNYVNQVVGAIINDPDFDGIDASKVNDASGETQQQVNYNGGSKWHSRVGGYKLNERVILTNGDIVKSTIDGNTVDPNVDMTGWVNPQKEQDILNDFSVNVDSFARYNTNGDWYNAIDKSIDKLITKGGGTLNFNPKTYVLKTPFNKTLPDNIKVHIQAIGATIDARTIKGGVAGDTIIFSIGGSVLTNSQLAADVAAMSSDITLSSNLSLKKGDILKIISTDLFEPSRAYYVKGEFVQVVSVSGNTIKTAGATYDAYTATTTKAEKLAMPNVTANGLSILCDANQIGLELIYCRNPSATGCTVNGSRYTGIRFYYCIGGDATRNNISDGWYVDTGTSYNIAVSSCQDFTVQNNHLREARHNIASGGTMPCRNIKYLYNDCFTHPDNGNFAAIDAHSNGEYFQIIGNNCESIVVSARHMKIRDNVIRSNKPNYQCLSIQAYLNGGRYELENNDVKATGVNSTAFYFAAVLPSVVTELLKISGGNLESTTGAILLKPRVVTAVGNIIKDLKIIDVSAMGVVIDSTGDAKLNIQNISTTRLKSKSGAAGLALFISQDSVVDNFTSTEDTYQRDSLNASIGRITAKKVTMALPTIKGESPTLKSRGFEFNSCENVKAVSPTIENCTVSIELTGSAGRYIESGRTVSNSVKTILNTAGSTIAESETRNGNLILSATAIPTVGSYTVGDYVRNTANTIITGTPNKRLIGWYRATTGSGHALGVDWIAEYAVLS